MRPSTARRWKIFLSTVLASATVSAVYGAMVGFATASRPGVSAATGLVVGLVNGALVSTGIGGIELFGTLTGPGRRLARAPLLVTVTIKAVLYGALIFGVVGGEVGVRVLGHRPAVALLDDPSAPLSLAFAFLMTFLFLFVLEMSRIVGGRALRDVVLGRYHRPRSEERFFLFVDVAGSTPLAERVGPASVHRFLGRVFRVASDPIEDHGGEVYQYVGDEMVITWTAGRQSRDERPVACFFAIVEALEAAEPVFERDIGVAPRVRGALHAGQVVTGEVGESRRAIVFHGDVMNTTSRLEQATRDLGRRFLASADALDRLVLDGRYALEDLGPQRLRGREAPVRVFAVERPRR